MKKSLFSSFFLLFFSIALLAQQKVVKNVIVLIPDGTSNAVLPICRWYNGGAPLHLDPYMCGMVRTFCSNAPIGDSAPTSSTYASGVLSRTGYVSTVPPRDENDLFPEEMKTYEAYQPAFTVLEAAKLQKKATGLVTTCEFTHATPADFSAHTPSRGKEYVIGKQIVYNNVDVVLSGGTNYLYKTRDDKEDLRKVLQQRGVQYIEDAKQLNQLKGPKAWGLFAEADLEYDVMRDPSKEPSLSEMTQKAVELLSQNEQGFFLMVEGSKVDWAAHAHNTKCVITDFLAFDKAVGVALDFARKNGNTAVVIMPDHGNGGLNICSPLTNAYGYSKVPLKTLLEPTLRSMAPQQYANLAVTVIRKEKGDKSSFNTFCSEAEKSLTKVLSNREKEGLKKSYDKICEIYAIADSNKVTASKKENISSLFISILNDRSYFGWTALGHTGEDVFLSVYHPNGYRPQGVVRNTEINSFLQEIMGISSLETLTRTYFSALSVSSLKKGDFVDTTMEDYPVLNIKVGKKQVQIPAYTNNVYQKKGKKSILNQELSTIVVYMKENKTFYLPESLKKELGY
ncbi:MAG: alkaline phosphatase [Bacteroidales bacterium]|nr:alkaline phosphatase [Bacteroidales bacterium]MDD4821112.1 alkaline phosphatase [Bacteroidales bacterium]